MEEGRRWKGGEREIDLPLPDPSQANPNHCHPQPYRCSPTSTQHLPHNYLPSPNPNPHLSLPQLLPHSSLPKQLLHLDLPKPLLHPILPSSDPQRRGGFLSSSLSLLRAGEAALRVLPCTSQPGGGARDRAQDDETRDSGLPRRNAHEAGLAVPPLLLRASPPTHPSQLPYQTSASNLNLSLPPPHISLLPPPPLLNGFLSTLPSPTTSPLPFPSPQNSELLVLVLLFLKKLSVFKENLPALKASRSERARASTFSPPLLRSSPVSSHREKFSPLLPPHRSAPRGLPPCHPRSFTFSLHIPSFSRTSLPPSLFSSQPDS